MKVSYEGNRITIDGKILTLDYPISGVLTLSDRVIVVFERESETEHEPHYERNVIALDRNGKMLWRIQRSVGRRTYNGKVVLSPYIGVQWFDQGGRRIIAQEWGCFIHDLDIETGKISNTIFTK